MLKKLSATSLKQKVLLSVVTAVIVPAVAVGAYTVSNPTKQAKPVEGAKANVIEQKAVVEDKETEITKKVEETKPTEYVAPEAPVQQVAPVQTEPASVKVVPETSEEDAAMKKQCDAMEGIITRLKSKYPEANNDQLLQLMERDQYAHKIIYDQCTESGITFNL